jgi:plastocyanin
MIPTQAIPHLTVVGALFATLSVGVAPADRLPGNVAVVDGKLSEWKVELSTPAIAAGTVTFSIVNAGSIPHGFEVEGQGIEKETPVIQPGATAALTLNLKAGTYEVYCPVGDDSHKMLGMDTHLTVVGTKSSGSPRNGNAGMSPSYMAAMSLASALGSAVHSIV